MWLLVGLLLLGVGLPLVVGAVAGSLEIPRNDDWSYRRIALELARTGRLALDGASQTMIVGQIVVTQPFLWLSGLQPWGFTAAGIVFAVGAMVAAYVMARQVLPPRVAIIPVLLLAVFPGYLAYATSYMSDVPAAAAGFACLGLGAIALARRPVPTGWLLAAVAVGVFALSIRDFAVAAPASVVLAAICAEPRRRRNWLIAIATAASCAGLYLWRSTLSGQLGEVAPHSAALASVLLAPGNVAFVLAPAAIIAAARWHQHWRRFDVIVGAEIGLAIVGFRAIQWLQTGSMPKVFIDNLMAQWGSPQRGYMVGGRPLLFPDPVWVGISVLVLAAIVVTFGIGAGIAGVHLRRWGGSVAGLMTRIGSPQGVLFLFTLGTVAGFSLYALRYAFFDRYLWPITPPLATLLLYVPSNVEVRSRALASRGRRWSPWLTATVALALLGTMAVIYLFNSSAFDIGRWRAGDALVRVGVPTDEIDAGYEWMGYYSTSLANAAAPAPGPTFYRGWWSSFQLCGLVSSAPQSIDGAELVRTITYELNLFAGPTETLYLYRIVGPDCAAAAG
jgi:4-amino-4-deoxy-L-arabinose transferase-like glycosyltransferase